jgi:multiple antibiotic resistance protein
LIAFLHDLLGIFAAVAPFGALPVFLAYRERSDPKDQHLLSAAPAVAFTVLAVAAFISDPFLDLIDVTGENFQLAAGVLMLPLAARLVLSGSSMPAPRVSDHVQSRPWILPLGFPMLAGPSAIAASISYAARFGELETILASALVCAATAALIWRASLFAAQLRPTGVMIAGHLSGLLLLATAFETAIDGIRSI